MATIILRPTADLAERVLLPGDPGRALRLAQLLLDSPKMFNHNRGLWGYSGTCLADGAPLTIQAAGVGGPSTAAVASELIALGARTLIRTGTCTALAGREPLGRLLVAEAAIAADGAGRALAEQGSGRAPGAEGARPVLPDPELTAALLAAGADLCGVVLSTDLLYGSEPHRDGWRAAGAIAFDLETAALLATTGNAGGNAGARAGSALILAAAGPTRIAEAPLQAAEARLGELAVRALVSIG